MNPFYILEYLYKFLALMGKNLQKKKVEQLCKLNWYSFKIFFGILFGPIDFRGWRDKIMFLISVLSVGLMKKVYVNLRKEIKEFISRIFYGRFNTSCHIGKVVVEYINNVFRVS